MSLTDNNQALKLLRFVPTAWGIIAFLIVQSAIIAWQASNVVSNIKSNKEAIVLHTDILKEQLGLFHEHAKTDGHPVLLTRFEILKEDQDNLAAHLESYGKHLQELQEDIHIIAALRNQELE